MKVREIHDYDEFLGLEPEWNALLATCEVQLPCLRHEWFRIWWRHFGAGHRMAVLVGRSQGRLDLVLPLMEQKGSLWGLPVRALVSMANGHTPSYYPLLRRGCSPELEALWRRLLKRPRAWDVLVLRLGPELSFHETLLARARADGFATESRPSVDSPYIPINGSWDDYFGSLKVKHRANLRNRTRRLDRLGRVSMRQVREPAEAGAALEAAFDIELRGWKGKAGSAMASRIETEDFYTELVELAAERGWLRLSFLELDGEPVAFDLSLHYGDRIHCLKIGYDPEWNPYSVGQLLCQRVLRQGFEEGLGEYDFGGHTTRQKRDWADRSRPHMYRYVYNRGLIARLERLRRFGVRRAAKRILPAGLVSWLKGLR